MIRLSARLRAIFDLVPEGAAVCDVGTDHGYLPAALASSGRACRVIATDIREKPLQNARENLEQFSVTNVELRLCDGLSAVTADEVDTVVIAGMGGDVIAGILERAEWLRNSAKTILLQPMTSAEVLRVYLSENGFVIACEPTLEENGKVYSIMKVEYTGKPYNLTTAQEFAGDISAATASGRRYIEKQYRRCSECAESLKQVFSDSADYQYYHTAAQELLCRLTEENHGI